MIYSDNVGAPGKGFEIRAGGVNYVAVNGTAAGNPVYLSAKGDDTNIALYIQARGDAPVYLKNDKANYLYATGTDTGVAPTLTATGSDTNVNLNLRTRNAGIVQANGVEVVTTSGTQTLTNKTLTGPTLDSLTASGFFLKDSNANNVLSYINLTTGTGVNYLTVRGGPAGGYPGFSATGTDTNISIFLTPKGSGTLRVYSETGNTPTIEATGADTNHNLNLLSKGSGVVQANGAEVVTVSGTQTLTNKTLTTPKVSTINDDNGNPLLTVYPQPNAVNYLMLENKASASGGPGIYSVGSDANIALNLWSKGTYGISLRTLANGVFFTASPVTSGVNYLSVTSAVTGAAPYMSAIGTDTNIDINLTPKGTGTVKANGVEVATVSDTQTLTNKTLTSPTITGTPTGIAKNTDVQVFTASGTWTKPAGAVAVKVVCIGPGGGGGAGARGPSGTALSGGGGGGAGGYSEAVFLASDLPTSVGVTVGMGGAGAPGQTVDDSAGANGSNPSQNTIFTGYLFAARAQCGGGGGLGVAGAASGTSGGGWGAGLIVGGGGAAGSATGAAGNNASNAPGGTGGGSGGGITTGATPNKGGNGGWTFSWGAGIVNALGGDGANGTTGGTSPAKGLGHGGGGGGASTTGNGYNGGDGGNYGAGGGGGGASLNGYTSGAGGKGGDGICIVVTYF